MKKQFFFIILTIAGIASLFISSLHAATLSPAPPLPTTRSDVFTIYFQSSRAEIQRGEAIQLNWDGFEAQNCTASTSFFHADGTPDLKKYEDVYNWSGPLGDKRGIRTLNPQVPTKYTITCTRGSYTVEKSAWVTVREEPAYWKTNTENVDVIFFPDRTIAIPGSSVVMNWKASDNTRCSASTISGGQHDAASEWVGTRDREGSTTIPFAGTATYSLECVREKNASTRIAFAVAASPSDPRAAKPSILVKPSFTTIKDGQATNIFWETTNAVGCSARPANGDWFGLQDVVGGSTVKPYTSTIYALTCWSAQGDSATQEVTVKVDSIPTVELDFSSSDELITKGNTVTLKWNARNAVSCTASGGWNGSKGVTGQELITLKNSQTVFGLQCWNPTGASLTRSIDVSLATPIISTAFPTMEFHADKLKVKKGDPIKLTWSTTNMDLCRSGTISYDWQGKETWGEVDDWQSDMRERSGAKELVPTKTVKYFLYCFGNGVRIKKTAKVIVTDTETQVLPDAAEVSVQFIADRTIVQPGDTVFLQWRVQRAKECFAINGWEGFRDPNRQEMYAITVSKSEKIGLECGNDFGYTTLVGLTLLTQGTGTPALPVGKPSVEIIATPKIAMNGEPLTVAWSSRSALSCAAWGSRDFFGFIPPTGSRKIFPQAAEMLTISCWSADGTMTRGSTDVNTIAARVSQTENISAKNSAAAQGSQPRVVTTPIQIIALSLPTVDFTTTPKSGSRATLSWNVQHAKSCVAVGPAPWVGAKKMKGSIIVSVKRADYYLLRCTNIDGVTVASRYLGGTAPDLSQQKATPVRGITYVGPEKGIFSRWFIDALKGKKYKLSQDAATLQNLRAHAIPVGNKFLSHIPLSHLTLKTGVDTDHDGLSDVLESALGTDPHKADTDNDGYPDGLELSAGFDPLQKKLQLVYFSDVAKDYGGMFVVGTESAGELWYIDPQDHTRIFIHTVADLARVLSATRSTITPEQAATVPTGRL